MIPPFPTQFSGVGVSLAPFNSVMAGLGDSYVADAWGLSANYVQLNDSGSPWPFGNAMGNGAFTSPVAANQGVVGNTQAQIAARTAATNATNARVVLLSSPGLNDITAAATSTAILTGDQTQIAALAAPYVILTTIPTCYAPEALTAPEDAVRVAVNAARRAMASRRVRILDLDAIVTDSSFMVGKHLSHKGTMAAGRALGTILETISVSQDLRSYLIANAIGTGNNAGLTGTTGTKPSGFATGDVATNWILQGTSGLTTTASKGTGDLSQIITNSGTYTGAAGSANYSFKQDAACSITAGQLLELICKFRILTNFANLSSIQIFNQLYSNDYGTIYASQFMPIGATGQLWVDTDGWYNLRSPFLAAGAGAGGAHIDTFFNVIFLDGTTLSATGSVEIAALGTVLGVTA